MSASARSPVYSSTTRPWIAMLLYGLSGLAQDSATCGLCRMFRGFFLPSAVFTRTSPLSANLTHVAVTCGDPSGLTVARCQNSLPSIACLTLSLSSIGINAPFVGPDLIEPTPTSRRPRRGGGGHQVRTGEVDVQDVPPRLDVVLLCSLAHRRDAGRVDQHRGRAESLHEGGDGALAGGLVGDVRGEREATLADLRRDRL